MRGGMTPREALGAALLLAVFFAGMALIRFAGPSSMRAVVFGVTGVACLAIANKFRRKF